MLAMTTILPWTDEVVSQLVLATCALCALGAVFFGG